MSHIPASAMPHAAPKHHDDEPHAPAMTTDAPAHAIDEAPVAAPSPAAVDPASISPEPLKQAAIRAAPARGCQVGVALAAGAVAVVAGVVAFGFPKLRSAEDATRGREG